MAVISGKNGGSLQIVNNCKRSVSILVKHNQSISVYCRSLVVFLQQNDLIKSYVCVCVFVKTVIVSFHSLISI